MISLVRNAGPEAMAGRRGATFDARFAQARLPNVMVALLT